MYHVEHPAPPISRNNGTATPVDVSHKSVVPSAQMTLPIGAPNKSQKHKFRTSSESTTLISIAIDHDRF